MSNDRLEVRLSGFGGQGIMLAGNILGRAAVLFDRKNATLTRSYGPEARGGASKTDVIISRRSIDCPCALMPDILVAMSHPAYLRYAPTMAPNGLLIVDTDLVHLGNAHQTERVVRVPFTRNAEEFGHRIVANMVMLGALVTISGVVSRKAMKHSVIDIMPEKVHLLNIGALSRGFDLGLQACSQIPDLIPAEAE